jgi:integrase
MTIRKKEPSEASNRSRNILSDNQINQILTLSAGDPKMLDLHDVVVIVSNTGIRAKELRELRWADVDFAQRRLAVTSKSCGVHSVPFELTTLCALEARREVQPKSEFVLGVSPRSLLNRVSRQLAALPTGIGIGRISMRTLRTTFAVRLVKAGMSPISMMAMLGLRVRF